ncbi:MAG TPA: hypothetical protein VFW33_03345, partial [Gemmataceae bacterium]|nr:hypothetical protein [Gemmataceae bacterium]
MIGFLERFGIHLIVGTSLGVLLMALLHHLYFALLPRRAFVKYSDSDPEWLRRYLERVLATPSLFGSGVKIGPHTALIGLYLVRGQHAEAADHCRAVLTA